MREKNVTKKRRRHFFLDVEPSKYDFLYKFGQIFQNYICIFENIDRNFQKCISCADLRCEEIFILFDKKNPLETTLSLERVCCRESIVLIQIFFSDQMRF